MSTFWKLTVHPQSWMVQQMEDTGEGPPIVMTPGQTFVLKDEEDGALEFRAGMTTAIIAAPLKGRARWSLFSDDEIRWLALGINVAEGEGLLPPATREGEVYAEFARSLEDVEANREHDAAAALADADETA